MKGKNIFTKLKPFLPAVLGVAGIAGLLLLLAVPAEKVALMAGAPAPAFEMTDLAGDSVKLADYEGKVLLIDFWATWCVTCEKEVPDLKILYKKYKGSSFELLAASVDEAAPSAVASFAAKKKLPWRVVFATTKSVKNYNVFGLPAKFLIDQDGKLYKTYQPDTAIEEIDADIDALLKKENI
jgi:peroxiredoxin